VWERLFAGWRLANEQLQLPFLTLVGTRVIKVYNCAMCVGRGGVELCCALIMMELVTIRLWQNDRKLMDRESIFNFPGLLFLQVDRGESSRQWQLAIIVRVTNIRVISGFANTRSCGS
jgi:hypothetical protein